MADELPYTVHSKTKITLHPEAKFWAEEHGLSLEEMARHLLAQHHEGAGEQSFNPLANALGYGDIGNIQPAVPLFSPTEPKYPEPFGKKFYDTDEELRF
jgi:hypothetical protein